MENQGYTLVISGEVYRPVKHVVDPARQTPSEILWLGFDPPDQQAFHIHVLVREEYHTCQPKRTTGKHETQDHFMHRRTATMKPSENNKRNQLLGEYKDKLSSPSSRWACPCNTTTVLEIPRARLRGPGHTTKTLLRNKPLLLIIAGERWKVQTYQRGV